MEHYDYPGNYTDRDEGARLAKVRLDAEQALDNRRHAAGDAISLYPGGLFKLVKHPKDAENVEYLVVRCSHAFVAESYRPASEEERARSTSAITSCSPATRRSARRC